MPKTLMEHWEESKMAQDWAEAPEVVKAVMKHFFMLGASTMAVELEDRGVEMNGKDSELKLECLTFLASNYQEDWLR